MAQSEETPFSNILESARLFRQNREISLNQYTRAKESYEEILGSYDTLETEEERTEATTKLTEYSKDMALYKMDSVNNYLAWVLKSAQDSGDFTNSEISVINAFLNQYSAFSENQKALIANAGLADMPAILNNIQTTSREVIIGVKTSEGVLISSDYQRLVKDLEDLLREIDAEVQNAQEFGVEVGEVQESYAQVVEDLSVAAAKYQEAGEKLNNAVENPGVNAETEAAFSGFKEAGEGIRGVVDGIKVLLQNISDLYDRNPWNEKEMPNMEMSVESSKEATSGSTEQ